MPAIARQRRSVNRIHRTSSRRTGAVTIFFEASPGSLRSLASTRQQLLQLHVSASSAFNCMLSEIDFGADSIGVIVGVGLGGAPLATLFATLYADRVGHRTGLDPLRGTTHEARGMKSSSFLKK